MRIRRHARATSGPWSLVCAPTGGLRATRVTIGAGALAELPEALAASFPAATRPTLVVDEALAAPAIRAAWSERVLRAVADPVLLPAGEASKTREVHARLEDELLARGLTRDDPVVALGGGALLDAVGFAAATVKRGLPWVAVPTTVVGLADASIGGKTAIDHPRGKNLLGAFHPPALVVGDPDTLATLPRRDVVAGLAELWKAGVVGDGELCALLTAGPPAGAELVHAIQRAVEAKVSLVEEDPFDTGARRVLNYGHTVGHALETLLGPDAMRHGEGVAIGMGVAATLAARRGLVADAFVAAQDAVLARLGLPTRVPAPVPTPAILGLVASDKKRRGGGLLTFVLPRGVSGVVVAEDVRREEVEAALDARRAPG